MFDWLKNLGRPNKETYPTLANIPDLNKEYNMDNVYQLPVPKAHPQVPPVKPPRAKEHYRVGFDDNGNTTLTVMADGSSMSLIMNQEACEHLIKMLRATYADEVAEDGN